LRDAIAKEYGASLSIAGLYEDDIRIRHTIDFLMNVDGDFEFYVSSKPPTVGCKEAAEFRINPEKILRGEKNPFGIELASEVKARVKKRGDALYFFIMPGDKNLDEKIASQLPIADLSGLGVVEFTVNPATVLSASDKLVRIFQHQELSGEFLSNNLGSRFLSCTISQDHYRQALAKLCETKKCEMREYDGTYGDFVKEAGLNPEGTISTPSGLSQLMSGDYYRSSRP
jgi:hypothetical protein